MTFPTVNFLTIPICALTAHETVDLIDDCIKHNEHIHHVVVNAAKVLAMQRNRQLYDSVVGCDIINADGQSIVWAARFLGLHIPERVTGIDLMESLIRLAHKNHYKCFFFGAKEEIVANVVALYSQKYSPDIIAGYRNGYYTKDEEPTIARQIADSGAQMLFVAISSPKKEIFLNTYNSMLHAVNFVMGVGGSFDVVAGVVKRAPQWMQKIGMEWFYRFIQEPRRMWRRYLIGNYQFIKLILKVKFKQRS